MFLVTKQKTHQVLPKTKTYTFYLLRSAGNVFGKKDFSREF